MTVIENGLFQFGHSKDHRPDLPQLKINQSVLDPLGYTAHDNHCQWWKGRWSIVYPRDTQSTKQLNWTGRPLCGWLQNGITGNSSLRSQKWWLLFVSLICFSNAWIRTVIVLNTIWNKEQPITRTYRPAIDEDDNPEQIAEGYGYTIHLESDEAGESFSWDKQWLVVRSLNHAVKSLEKRST